MLDEIIALAKKLETNKEFYLKIAKFVDEMIKIQEEKKPIYRDTWQTISLGTLKSKMIKQIGNLVFRVSGDNDKAKRALIHIANYCFFLYNRLGD